MRFRLTYKKLTIYYLFSFSLSTAIWFQTPSAFAQVDNTRSMGAMNPQILKNRAQFFYKERAMDSARFYYQALAEQQIIQNQWEDWLDTQNQILTSYFLEGAYEKALKNAKKITNDLLSKAEQAPDKLARYYYILGHVHNQLKDHQQSIISHKKTLKFLQENGINNIDLESKTLHSISTNLYYTDQLAEAEKYAKMGLALVQNTRYEEIRLPRYYNSLGSINFSRGDYKEALYYYQSIVDRELARVTPRQNALFINYFNSGLCYRNLELYNESKNAFKRAIDLYKENQSNISENISKVINAIGLTYLDNQDLDSALYYFRQAVPLLKEKNDKLELAINYNAQGSTYYKKTQIDSASFYLETAKDLLFTNSNSEFAKYYLSINLKNQGEIALNQKNLSKAREDFQESISVNTASTQIEDAIRFRKYLSARYLNMSLWGLARTYTASWQNSQSEEDREQALKYFRLCDEVMQSIRDTRLNKIDKIVQGGDHNIYNDAAYFCRQLGPTYLEETHYFMERSKAYVLQDLVHTARSKNFGGIPRELVQEEKRLQDQIFYYQQGLLGNTLRVDDAQAMDSLDLWQDKLESHLADMQDEYPQYYALKYGQKIVTTAQVQAEIDPHTAVLSYLVGTDKLMIQYLDHQQSSVFSFPIGEEELGRKTRPFFSAINGVRKNYPAHAYELYEILLKPFEANLENKKHLLIVPDGDLHRIPFEALITRESDPVALNQPSYAQLDYLINQYTVTYYPSLTLAFHGAYQPDQRNYTQEFIGIAPVFADGGNTLSNTRALDYMQDNPGAILGKRLKPLPYSLEEVQAIDSLFKAHQKCSKILVHQSAREDSLKMGPVDSRCLHFSTHGLLNPSHPEFSGIALYQPDSSDYNRHQENGIPIQDGILYQSEIFNLRLNSELVVLSSCESGRGKSAPGEGILSLSRGFMYAGAPRIIHSLWKISDRATAEMMIEFYKYQLEGLSYRNALSMAKRAMIRDPRNFHPRKWSGLLLMSR